MNKHLIPVLAGSLALALAAVANQAFAAPQIEHAEACCLAAEWLIDTPPSPPQLNGEFCCIANEWQAPSAAVVPIESRTQATHGEACCLAAEWDAS